MAAEGLAVIMISSELPEVLGMSDRVMVMQAGEIVEEGATEALFTAPRHPYTRALLAAAPQLEATP